MLWELLVEVCAMLSIIFTAVAACLDAQAAVHMMRQLQMTGVMLQQLRLLVVVWRGTGHIASVMCGCVCNLLAVTADGLSPVNDCRIQPTLCMLHTK
jgi:hypothetical protein